MFVVWSIYRNEPQCIDACRFVRNAVNNYNNGTLYPSRIDLYQDYITAVGYSNLLQLIHVIFGRLGWMQFVNMAMNIGIVCEMYYIAWRLFSPATGYIAVSLYCLMTTNIFPFLQLVTEIPYLFFAMSGFALCLRALQFSASTSRVVVLFVVAGISFGIAHTMRPLELAFLVPVVGYVIYATAKAGLRKVRVVANCMAVLLPYFILLFGVGMYFKAQTGVFINGSMTGWYNFVRAADPKSPISSGWTSQYEKGGIAYIPHWERHTVVERNNVFRDSSLKWLEQHPFKFTAIFAIRAAKLWGADYFYIPNITGYDDKVADEAMPNPSRALIIRRVVEIGYSFVWYATLLLCVMSLMRFIRKKKFGDDNQQSASYWLLLSVLILGTIGTALFPVEVRYHYPYTWAMTILGAESIRELVMRRKVKKQNSSNHQTRA